jgi:hypothetical protein
MVSTQSSIPKGVRFEDVNVRFGSEADSCSAATHVRFGPIADIGLKDGSCVFTQHLYK